MNIASILDGAFWYLKDSLSINFTQLFMESHLKKIENTFLNI
jgi:hypothetical protein